MLYGAAALLAVAPPALADDGLVARLGFAGAVKVGVPVPLTIELPAPPEGGPARLTVDVPALGPQAGAVVTRVVLPFDAVAGAHRVFRVPVVLSDIRRPLVVRAALAGRPWLRGTVPIDPALVGGRLVATLAAQAAGLAPLARLPERVVAVDVPPADLPDQWQAYAALDLLVVRDLGPARLDDAQRRALLDWVRLGGRVLAVVPPGEAPPSFLEEILPASVGPSEFAVAPGAGGSGAGADLPEGSFPVSSLVPHPGASVTRAGGTPVIAAGRVGAGWAGVWGFDPGIPAFADWPGRARLWADAIGPPRASFVRPDAVAGLLPAAPSLDPLAHAEVSAAAFAYLAALFLAGRRRMSRAGMLVSLGVVTLALVGFSRLASDVHARSSSVTQVTFVEQAPGTALAQTVTVGAVAVAYGGRYRLAAPPGSVVAPLTASGDLRAVMTDQGAVFAGTLAPGGAPRAFEAIDAVPFAARAELAADGRALMVNLGGDVARRVELHWGSRWYWIGDVPSGPRTYPLDPGRWVRSSGTDADGHDRSWIFLGPQGGVIMDGTTPVVVGEIRHAVPAFHLEDGGTLGQQTTIMLVPVERR